MCYVLLVVYVQALLHIVCTQFAHTKNALHITMHIYKTAKSFRKIWFITNFAANKRNKIR